MISRLFGPWVEKVCRAVSAKVPSRVITGLENKPYLARYYLFRRNWMGNRFPWLPSVYLHFFYRGDEDEELHNHPWGTSLSLILTGGYEEERRDGEKTRFRVIRPGMFNLIRKDDFHRVTLLEPQKGAWTLFITGTREQDWGFWHPETKTYISWQEHVRRREEANSAMTTLEKDIRNIELKHNKSLALLQQVSDSLAANLRRYAKA